MAKRFKQDSEQETELQVSKTQPLIALQSRVDKVLEPLVPIEYVPESYIKYEKGPIDYRNGMFRVPNLNLLRKILFIVDTDTYSDCIYIKFEGFPCVRFSSKQVVGWFLYWYKNPAFGNYGQYFGTNSYLSSYNKLQQNKENNHIVKYSVYHSALNNKPAFNAPAVLIFKESECWLFYMESFTYIVWYYLTGCRDDSFTL